LLSGRAAGAPNRQPAARGVRLRELGQELVAKRAELVLLPEEIRFLGREALDRLLELGRAARIEAQELVVAVEIVEAERFDAIDEPTLEEEHRVVVVVEARVLVEQIAQEPELLRAELGVRQKSRRRHRGR